MSGPVSDDLTALVGSRICHDLISPLGAIGNGLELLQMSGHPETAEFALIAESVQNANARIRFFRIAYGAADPAQTVRGGELQTALKASFQGTRLSIDWAPQDMARNDARFAFLAIQCLETALPYGGSIHVETSRDGLILSASAERIALDNTLWSVLTGSPSAEALRPAQVQFGLLAEQVAQEGRMISVTHGDTWIRVTA